MAGVDVGDFCLSLRQGDILATTSIAIGAEQQETPFGVAVISQTCDLVRLDRHPNVVVARVVELDEDSARDAERGRTARWTPLVGAPGRLFADLNAVGSISKAAAAEVAVTHCIPDESWDDQRELAQRIGRWFSRLALPDNVVPWLSPLQRLVMDRANKPTSAMGRALDSITQFRIHSKFWSAPYDLTLYLVIAPGELPLLEDGLFRPLAPGLMAQLGDTPSVSDVAALLFPLSHARPVGADRQALWSEFASAVARLVFDPTKHSGEIQSAVRDVTVEVVGEDEFTMSQWRRTGELDFAHLSSPLPAAAGTGSDLDSRADSGHDQSG